MGNHNKLRMTTKKALACLLSTLTVASCAAALPITTSTQADAASMLSNQARNVIYASSRTDFRDESIYFLITTRFYDGDPSNNARTSEDEKAQNPASDPSWRGDFAGLIEKLDYIKALGFTAIWITPVVENKSGYDYHGYHAYDFTAVDNRYESNGVTYQTLIDACHAKGMKVIQDVVFNHSCNWGEKNLLKLESDVYTERNSVVMNGTYGPGGQYTDSQNIYHHNGFCSGGDWDEYAAQNKTIADDCFDFETENPIVYNYLIDCYKNFIDMGVDAFRVDTVKHISRLTLNSTFIPELMAEANKIGNNKFYMFGEVCTKGSEVWYRGCPPISTAFYTWKDDTSWTSQWSNDLASNEALVESHHAAYNNTGIQPTSNNAFLDGNNYHTPDYSQRSGLDVIDFQMHWDFENAGKAFGTALGEDQYFNDSTWNVVYVDSHDFAPNVIQTIRPDFGTDTWAENLSLMFTFRGIPCVFYGSEIEFQAGKVIDKGPNLPLSETGRAYYGDNIEGTVTAADFTVFQNVSGTVANTLNSTLSQHIMRLNRLRQAIPALRKGQYSTEGCSSQGGIAFKRRYTDSTTDSFCLVAISSGATFSGIPNGTYVDAVTGDTQTVTGGTLTASVSGRANMKVYVLSTSLTPAPGRVIPNGDYLNDGGSAELIGPEPFDIVDVTSVTLDKTTVSVKEGATATVTATVAPDNATDKSLKWTSSDNSVATVANGTIKGLSIGTATITATSNSNPNKSATVTVTVIENPDIVRPTGITVSPTTLTLTAGESSALTATVAPSNATDKTVTWTSSNASVATVSNGTVTAVGAGTATITATTSNGKTATATVTVEGKKITYIENGVYFEKPASWGSSVNAYIYDSTTNSPVGSGWPGTAMTDDGNNVYYLKNTTSSTTLKVIFNDGNNQIPGSRQPGFDYVNRGYYTSAGYQYTVEQSVDVPVTSVTLDSSSATIAVGSSQTLTATVAPADATNKTLTWTSSNNSVATVSNGVVTGVAAGTATITASSNNGKTASATITVRAVPSNLVNDSTVVSDVVSLGSSVTVKNAASGGDAPYTYAVYYKLSSASSYTTAQDFSSTTTTKFTPSKAGTYDIISKVKDSSGTIAKANMTVTVQSDDSLLNNSALAASTINAGGTVTVKGSASGGSGSYTYAAYYKLTSASSYTTARDFGSTANISFTLSTAGTYDVCSKVKDSSGTIAKKYFTVTVKKVTELTNNTTLAASTITLGSKATVKNAAAGGSGSYTYYVYYKKSSDSDWVTAQDGTSATSVTFTPGKATTYNVCTKVKDSAGTVAKKYLTLTVNAAMTNTSKLSSTTLTVGKAITVYCSATGGTGYYNYAVYYKKSSDSSWVTVQDYSSNDTVSIKPAKVTTYNIKVKAKDSSGAVAAKTLNITVKAAELVNNSTLAAASINLGSKATVKNAATGGTGSYTYYVYYKKTTDSDWVTAQDGTTVTTASFKPGKATTYNVCSKVKDSAGTVAKKYLTLKVTAALTNNSTLAASSITLGNKATVKNAATGGSGSYTYYVYYKKTSDSDWVTAQEGTTATTATFKPGKVATYDVCSKVKDSKGTVVKKYLTLKVTSAALTNNSTLAASSITLGSKATVKNAASGGSGSYTYYVYYKKTTDSDWVTAQDGTTATTATFKPGKVATYDVCSKVKDSKGTVVKKYLTLKVTSAALTNNTKLAATSITYGNKATVKNAASGGSGSYTYYVYYKKTTDSDWVTAQNGTTATSATFKPGKVATYDVCSKVKDSKGTVVKKYLTLKVTSA